MSVVTVSYLRDDENQSFTVKTSGAHGSGMTSQSFTLLQKLVDEALGREGFTKIDTQRLSDNEHQDRWELAADK